MGNRCAGDAIPRFTGIGLSGHPTTFQEVWGLAAVRGRLPPHIHWIGWQPADPGIGLGLSPVAAALPEVVYRATSVSRAWGQAT